MNHSDLPRWFNCNRVIFIVEFRAVDIYADELLQYVRFFDGWDQKNVGQIRVKCLELVASVDALF